VKHKQIIRIVLLLVAVFSVVGFVYVNSNKIPESCGSSLSPYANCVHYRYSEWLPFLGLFAIVACFGLIGSFLIKNAKYQRVLAILLLVVTLVVTGFILWKDKSLSSSPLLNSEEPHIISGKVTSISDQCHVDGVCSVTLDNTKTIITGCGLMPGGKTCKMYDQSKLRFGQQVEATVVQSDKTTYSLECDSCTMRPLD
jgi:amino acid transporter